jgi:hypothetical protein
MLHEYGFSVKIMKHGVIADGSTPEQVAQWFDKCMDGLAGCEVTVDSAQGLEELVILQARMKTQLHKHTAEKALHQYLRSKSLEYFRISDFVNISADANYFGDLENIIRIALHMQANPIPENDTERILARARVRNALHELVEAIGENSLDSDKTITYAKNFILRQEAISFEDLQTRKEFLAQRKALDEIEKED